MWSAGGEVVEGEIRCISGVWNMKCRVLRVYCGVDDVKHSFLGCLFIWPKLCLKE